jgi:hypothetical protein
VQAPGSGVITSPMPQAAAAPAEPLQPTQHAVTVRQDLQPVAPRQVPAPLSAGAVSCLDARPAEALQAPTDASRVSSTDRESSRHHGAGAKRALSPVVSTVRPTLTKRARTGKPDGEG